MGRERETELSPSHVNGSIRPFQMVSLRTRFFNSLGDHLYIISTSLNCRDCWMSRFLEFYPTMYAYIRVRLHSRLCSFVFSRPLNVSCIAQVDTTQQGQGCCQPCMILNILPRLTPRRVVHAES